MSKIIVQNKRNGFQQIVERSAFNEWPTQLKKGFFIVGPAGAEEVPAEVVRARKPSAPPVPHAVDKKTEGQS